MTVLIRIMHIKMSCKFFAIFSIIDYLSLLNGSHFSNTDFEDPSYGIEYEYGFGLVNTSIPFEKTNINTITKTKTIILKGSKFFVLKTLAEFSSAL